MTFRSFVGAGVLFVGLLGSARTSQADPVILDGLITKPGEFSAASVQFSGTEDFSFMGAITPFASFAHGTCFWFNCLPGATLQLGGIASGSDVLGTVTIGTESFRAGGVDLRNGSLHLVFDGSAVLPPVVEPTGFVSAPFSLAGVWTFPAIPAREPPRLAFSGSGIVTAFLAPSVIQTGVACNKSGVSVWERSGAHPGAWHPPVDGHWIGRTGAAAIHPPIAASGDCRSDELNTAGRSRRPARYQVIDH